MVDETIRRTPSGGEVVRRLIVFGFGLIQLVITLRIVLLLLVADRANDLVRGIYDVSGTLIAPFEGILRTNAIGASGSILDLAAVVALIGWTVLEVVVVSAVGIARREP
jgi:hypothetical protein